MLVLNTFGKQRWVLSSAHGLGNDVKTSAARVRSLEHEWKACPSVLEPALVEEAWLRWRSLSLSVKYPPLTGNELLGKLIAILILVVPMLIRNGVRSCGHYLAASLAVWSLTRRWSAWRAMWFVMMSIATLMLICGRYLRRFASAPSAFGWKTLSVVNTPSATIRQHDASILPYSGLRLPLAFLVAAGRIFTSCNPLKPGGSPCLSWPT